MTNTAKRKILYITLAMLIPSVSSCLIAYDVPEKSYPTISELPELSPISYGETLENSAVLGGHVCDKDTGTEVVGTWKIYDPQQLPADGDEIRLLFDAEDEGYFDLTVTVPAKVEETTPEVVFDVDVIADDPQSGTMRVSVWLTLCNPVNEDLLIEDTPRIFYKTEADGEFTEIEDGYFLIDSTLSGETLYLQAQYEGSEGKYTSLTANTEFVPEDCIKNYKHDGGGAWILLGIFILILLLTGYVLVPIILIVAPIVVLAAFIMTQIIPMLIILTATAIILFIILKKSKKERR